MKDKNMAYRDFGLNTHVMPWTETDGTRWDAVIYRVFVSVRHAVSNLS